MLCATDNIDWNLLLLLCLDISASNVSFGVRPEAFSSEALERTFECDCKGSVELWGVPETEKPPRPGNLPEYLIARCSSPLMTDGQDMSKVDIIDFGKGSSFSSLFLLDVSNML